MDILGNNSRERALDPEQAQLLARKHRHDANRFATAEERTMELVVPFKGKKIPLYKSAFSRRTGTIVRAVNQSASEDIMREAGDDTAIRSRYGDHRAMSPFFKAYLDEVVKLMPENSRDFFAKIAKMPTPNEYVMRSAAFSPVPECVDVEITNYCTFGCQYCYTDATGRGKHMTPAQLEKIITGFKMPPYQMAFGGGSPTSHPEFETLLALTAELGVVPNYTTEGEGLTPRILDATRRYCGGVALTYHHRKGESEEETLLRFADRYQTLKDAGIGQINVHVIAGNNVFDDLNALLALSEKVGPLNIVLLAYYPNVGRDNGENLPSMRAFSLDLPPLIQTIEKAGNVVAYSQGLLPFFKSRPELKKATHTHRMEGYMTVAIDVDGYMTHSSFYRLTDDDNKANRLSAFDVPSQLLWLTLPEQRWMNNNYDCGDCDHVYSCGGSREDTLQEMCAYSSEIAQVVPEVHNPEVERRSYSFSRERAVNYHWFDIWDSQYRTNIGYLYKPDKDVSEAIHKRFPGALETIDREEEPQSRALEV